MIAEHLPLFDPPKEVPGQRAKQAMRTLSQLKLGPQSTLDLLVVGPRPAAYVRQLRMMGYIIVTEMQDTVAVYSLLGKEQRIEVTDAMKAAYYMTSHWRAKRLVRMEFDGFKCCCCSAKQDLQVHHWKYDLFNEAIEDLLTVCVPCHKRLHDYENVHCHFPKYVKPEVAELLEESA